MNFTYAPALESTAACVVRERYGLFIGGAWVAPRERLFTALENPATQATLALVAHADASDVDRAVHAARRAYDKSWRKLRATDRSTYVFRLARAIAERTAEFAIGETLDCGLPIRAAREAVARAVERATSCAGWADKLSYAVGPSERARSVGVVAAVLSSTAPLASAIEILAPALACGNTVVVKPAAATPLCALILAAVCAEIDLPPGVVNVVSGDAETAAALCDHDGIDLVAFEGSFSVARSLRMALAGRSVRRRFRLCGSASVVVFDDAPIDAAVEAIVAATNRSGATPATTGTRVLVHESIAADVLERSTARLATLRHGEPLDRNTDVGALPSRALRDARAARIDLALAAGATAIAAPWIPPERGYFFPATILAGLPGSFDIGSTAGVGPIVAFDTFRTPDEAIERANAVAGALRASVWTCGGALASWAAQRLEAGVVWCNTFDRFDPRAPDGGVGASGSGYVGGLAGLRAYLDC